MILHIPHASTNTLDKQFLCNLEQELERMTDVKTDVLFDCAPAARIVFPVSRLICDVERFEDDALESMANKGMGVCYTINSFGQPLRTVTKAERNEIIANYYRPHHRALTEAVQRELDTDGKALIIDCHSFSNEPLHHEDSQCTPRPDICIGTDDFHTPTELLNDAVKHFESCGYDVKVNAPFSGTIIPMDYFQTDSRVHGIMIELNRDLYKTDFDEVQSNVTEWLATFV
jgi:N-formylglutamate amidohydrolase